MNNKGTRRANGEGYIGDVIQKIKRPKKLNHICDICKNCTDRSLCNNRTGTEKCQKCIDCKECLKDKNYCDRFYCYFRYQAQISIDKKQTTVANENKKKAAVDKKLEVEAKVQTKSYVQKNGITISEVCKKIQKNKFEANLIGKNTKSKDKYHYRYIDNWDDFKKPVQKVTYQNINDFLNSITHLSQSEIGHIVNKLKAGFMECVLDKIIAYPDNPMLRITVPNSLQTKKKVEAFEVSEQRKLMRYIRTQPLIKSSKCNYDERTLRNLFICLLLTAARIGELGALDYTKHLDFSAGGFIINRTLTQEDGKIIMGEHTKTGQKKVSQGQLDERFVPFDIFDEKLLIDTVKDQMQNAKSNFNNKEHLLFCQKDGSYIDYRCLNNIFKRICREAGVKLDLPNGCHIHMCRHTGATRMIEAGMDLLVIAAILGHVDDRQIKETYGHILARYRNRQLKNSRAYYKQQRLSA
ncbi:tyrosine-type recombinase/integrase [Intestinibacter sp.]|uniref:tyrosine-type recombinase/integrase n=1 Tax=Intestinibacter sp. TaxID=1965304 RepID=UPI002A75E377|nr:tyrosine-type recombinase/integrase [Intestinibacter sp.]MDY2736240.1 tyrosine-type recombinase/integrase [Intestinibacter sp.]